MAPLPKHVTPPSSSTGTVSDVSSNQPTIPSILLAQTDERQLLVEVLELTVSTGSISVEEDFKL